MRHSFKLAWVCEHCKFVFGLAIPEGSCLAGETPLRLDTAGGVNNAPLETLLAQVTDDNRRPDALAVNETPPPTEPAKCAYVDARGRVCGATYDGYHRVDHFERFGHKFATATPFYP